MLTCNQERLLLCYYEELPANEKLECEQHIRQCTRCQDFWESLHEISSSYQALEKTAVTKEFSTTIKNHLKVYVPSPSSLLFAMPLARAALVMIAIALLSSLFIVQKKIPDEEITLDWKSIRIEIAHVKKKLQQVTQNNNNWRKANHYKNTVSFAINEVKSDIRSIKRSWRKSTTGNFKRNTQVLRKKIAQLQVKINRKHWYRGDL